MKVTSVAGTSIGVTMPAYVNGIPSGTVTGGTLTISRPTHAHRHLYVGLPVDH